MGNSEPVEQNVSTQPVQNGQQMPTMDHDSVMNQRKAKIIVTLGPSTKTEQDLRKIKDKGVDFVRVNMSHSSLEDLAYSIDLSKKVGIPFIIDTEGSQVRTGELERDTLWFDENVTLKIYGSDIIGNLQQISLRPHFIIEQLEPGDLIHIDFDTLIMRVMDISTAGDGYITAKTISGGFVGKNKAVVIDPILKKKLRLPPLSPKDYQSIELGLKADVAHIAVSFVRSGASVDEVREVTQNRMKIISKIECVDALENLDDILQKSDYVLIDRGDLSKEIAIEKIPFTQKVIIDKARQYGTAVFVATNLLETMIEKKNPTRAEVHDVINTIVDGAHGLTLAAETAVGKYPMECINMLNKLIRHAELMIDSYPVANRENGLIQLLAASNYLLEETSSSLIVPHGGKLVSRVLVDQPEAHTLTSLPKIVLDLKKQMDLEQIANGVYSPLEGFMGEADFHSVLDDMRLASGVVWPIPITLDVAQETADQLTVGQPIRLVDEADNVIGLLHLSEKYRFDRDEMASKMFGTNHNDHPGVKMVQAMQPVLLGGKIDLLQGRRSETKAYELAPSQLRRLFEARGWAKVLGFHTRNVIHRGHEFMQLKAMEEENCDGILLHPVIGKKKPGDYHPKYIIKSYEEMIERFYPKNKVILAAFSTFSRYAGPREALFTALCRKNFGCSHFIVGRDHTGVGSFYDPHASHRIFDQFPEIGIRAVKFDEVFYSKSAAAYIHATGDSIQRKKEDTLKISGTQARKMFESKQQPPDWFMRPEISQIILDAIAKGEQVFVNND